MNGSNQDLAKRYAAMAYALGLARGALSDVVSGEFDRDMVLRIYDATAAVRIAESLGVDEEAIAVDWDDYLNPLEKRKLQGDGSEGPRTET